MFVIPPPDRRPPNQGITILLYIAGIALVITAIILVLRGTGVLKQVPDYLIWAIVLFTIGAGILGGLKSTRRW
jgi:amino acid transporter